MSKRREHEETTAMVLDAIAKGTIRTTTTTTPTTRTDDDDAGGGSTKKKAATTAVAVKKQTNETFRLPPAQLSWKASVHYHHDLSLVPSPSNDDNSNKLLLSTTFQAKARESLAVSLTSEYGRQPPIRPGRRRQRRRNNHNQQLSVEILLGDGGNTRTTIRQLPYQNKKKKNPSYTSVVPGRVCQDRVWTDYWICATATVTATSATAKTEDKDDHDEEESSSPPPSISVYVGLGSNPGQHCFAVFQVNVMEFSSSPLNTKLDEKEKEEVVKEESTNAAIKEEEEMPTPRPAGQGDPDETTTLTTEQRDDKVKKEEDDEEDKGKQTTAEQTNNKTMEEEDNEKKKNDDIVFFRYVGFRNASTADRQAPSPLQIRNIVLTNAVEPEVLEQLKGIDSQDDLDMAILGEEEEEDPGSPSLSNIDRETVSLLLQYRDACSKAKERASKFGITYTPPSLESILPWSHVRRLRANPTFGGTEQKTIVTGMDITSAEEKAKQEQRRARFGGGDDEGGAAVTDPQQQQEQSEDVLPVEQAWDKIDLVGSQRMDPPMSLWKEQPTPEEETTKTKDEFTMLEDNPTLVPEKIHICSVDWAAFKQIRTNDILAHFSLYGPSFVEWLGDLCCNVLFEDKFSAARALEHMSQKLPSPPPAPAATEGTDETSEIPDLGCMGWRWGNQVLRKKSNDRYGRKGTMARLLMRVATSKDILHNRPSSWPKPPPGFTTKRVLGPESDIFKKEKKPPKSGKGTKRNQGESNDASTKTQKKNGPLSTEEMLSGGLSAGRAGFSVEEMEAERAKKRSKVTES